MKAFLLATGERDNLRVLTTQYPSPMLPVADRPVLTYPVELLARHRIREIIVTLLRQPHTIEAYCGTGRRWNVDFTYLLLREALGSAGALRRAQGLLTETFLVMPGDALVDVDLSELVEFHRSHGGIATALLATRADGNVEMPVAQLDPNSRLHSIQTEAQTHAQTVPGLSFTNVFVFEPEICQFISHQTACDCSMELLPRLLAEGEAVHGFVLQGYWNPLDSFAAYQSAQQDYLRSLGCETVAAAGTMPLRHPYVEAGHNGDGIWRGHSTMIHPSAQIHAPVLIGAGSQIGRAVTIGPNAIIGANSIVDEGATIENSTVLPNTYIGQWASVQSKVVNASTLIDIESETSVVVADRQLLGRAGLRTANALLRNLLERLIALMLLLIATPFLAVLALLTWMAGGGSIFVRASRVGFAPSARFQADVVQPGEGGRAKLHLLRFRTRLENGCYTSFGRWMEAWDFHRLPELINVLLGQLALVGVKPLGEAEADLILEEWQRRRPDCAAGFTGCWYTETTPNSSADELFVADAYQAAVQSVQDSVLQLLKTPVAWWHRHEWPLWQASPKRTRRVIQGHLPQYVDDNPLKQ